jgi:hypothetical protein
MRRAAPAVRRATLDPLNRKIMKRIHIMAAAALLVAGTGDATAQVFTPTFTSPRPVNELGIGLSSGPGDLAIEGIWRGGQLGLRVGYVDAADGLLSIGAEVRSPLPVTGAPLGLAFTAGGQALVGDIDAAGVQTGLSAGYTFMGNGMAFTPYMHPRVGMINHLGGNSDWDFEVMADIGADLEFANNLLLRLGINVGDVGASWGVGIGWRR